MKIFLYSLFFLSFSAFGQNLTFNETVAYINDKLEKYERSNKPYCKYTIEAEETGLLKIHHYEMNEMMQYKENIAYVNLKKASIQKTKHSGIDICANIRIEFGESGKVYFVGIISNNDEDANRLLKAFKHLQMLSNSYRDPFDE